MTDFANDIATRIKAGLPDAVVDIDDPDGMHLAATVTSTAFAGKSRMQQHRMVYAALGNAFENDLHALQLTTRTPAKG
jgi:stress-induced morphogen